MILILTGLISFIAYSVTSKTSYDIIEFIDKLDADEILDSGMNLMVTQTEAKELAIIKKTILNLCDNIKNIENKKKNVEIELVQSKINPHTMYNSLSAIRLKAFETKQQEIINIVDTMAEYYRMVLNRGQNITLLCDEIAMLEKYVAVNELSNYIKYGFKVELPAEIRNCRIPHLILLPFIENAVNHGLPGMTSGGKISVSCKRDGEFLEIIITDNGVGIKPEMLEKLHDLENYDLGYGIKNVYQRLNLIYGSESTIEFESAYREGTRVTVRFKCFDENGKEIIRR